MLLTILFILIAYVVGSLNSAILVCKAMKLPDPRGEGSGNPGATNVLRIGGRTPALLVLTGDILKGLLPVLLAAMLGVVNFGLGCVALAAVVGHMYPVFFKFQGGKGVATAFGAMLVLSFWVAILLLVVFAVVIFITRYVSLASLISVVFAAILILFVHTSYFLPILAMAGLIVWRHKENIDRLKLGSETKVQW